MKGSRTRVMALLEGRTPDRVPLYDLIRNDAVLEHFAGEILTLENAHAVVHRAIPEAVDATRPALRLPTAEYEDTLPDGRRRVFRRWTTWTEHVTYPSSEAYAEAKEPVLSRPLEWTESDQRGIAEALSSHRETQARVGEEFFLFFSGPSLGLMSIYGEVGLEAFCYYLADCPETIDLQLQRQTERAVQWIEHLPEDHGVAAVFSGDDIAFTNGPLLGPDWFESSYFPRLKRVVEAYHRRGIAVNFHSDGDLNLVLDGLVATGIDMLNPIEVLAGMDIGVLRRRYPDLILAGGIDVSQLLPFGTPEQVRDATVKAIEDAEGKIMIGSSTELQNTVPLENFLAMREAAITYKL